MDKQVKQINDLTRLEIRAMLSRAVNAGINGGMTPLEMVLMVDSIKADLLMTVPYQALSDQEKERQEIEAAQLKEAKANQTAQTYSEEESLNG